MRIRKHAKISPLLFTASSLDAAAVTQTHHLCLLNQSPWDVVTFPPQDPATLPPPPPPFLVDGEYYCSYLENRTLGNHITAYESPKKEKWDDDDIATAAAAGGVNRDEEKVDSTSSKPKKLEEEEEIVLCSKTDKKGWQCGKIVKNGNPFCDHHLPKGKSHNNSTVHSKKSDENRRRTGHRRPSTSSSSSNPYEFYYYSGFGPRWGKKRGTSSSSGSVVKRELYDFESGSGSGSDTPPSSIKNATLITKVADNNAGPNPSATATSAAAEPNNVNGHRIGNVEDEYEDEFEDYEEDFDEDNGGIGKKRGRKPIKARSLKSLM